MADIKAPVFPESVQDGTIVEWHVAEGEAVSRDQLLAEVETDKVVLEIVAPDDGVITSIVKNVDDTVLSAEVVATFEAGAAAPASPPVPAAAGPCAPAAWAAARCRSQDPRSAPDRSAAAGRYAAGAGR